MSCALSAIVRPSRRLRCLIAALCAALVAAALAVGVGAPERFACNGLVAAAPLAGALALGWTLIRSWRHPHAPAAAASSQVLLLGFGTRRRLDISGLGQLRLTVQQERRAVAPAGQAEPVTLLPGAIVWPCCMLLRLRAADGNTGALVVLPDSLSPDQYRALAVAVRALANGAVGKNSMQNRLNLLQEANS